MPNIEVKLRRGTTAQHSTFTGAEGEVTVDTDKDTVVVHDGVTAGGHELRKRSDSSFAVLEVGNATAAYIDLKTPDTDDYDGRLISQADTATLETVHESRVRVESTSQLGFVAGADPSTATPGPEVMTIKQTEVVVNEQANDVDFIVKSTGNGNLINTDAANDAVGVGIAAESGYALKSSKIKIEGTAAQLWMKDSDQSTAASGYEANLALNTGALRVGFTGETVPSMTLYPDGVLGLPSMSVATANGITTAARGAVNGAIIAVSNGDAGSPCLAVYDEVSSSWLRIALGSAISAT